MSGRTGLDYAGVASYMHQVARIRPKDFARMFEELRSMEAAALEEWRQQQESKS